MANMSRKLGISIYELMQKAGIARDSFAEQMEYTEKELYDVVEGKKLLSPLEIGKIAAVLGITKAELINYHVDSLVPELQCTKKFSAPEHLDIILDLMDEYVECRECV